MKKNKHLGEFPMPYPPDFEIFWRAWPRKKNKSFAFREWRAAIAAGHDPVAISAAAAAYNGRLEAQTWLASREWLKNS